MAETTTRSVDEADLLEQLAPLPVDNAEEYPNIREPGPGGAV
jgi:hypothetical protein